MAFYRVTTPVHTFKLPVDTSECAFIQVSYTQGRNQLLKVDDHGTVDDGVVLDEDCVVISFTQEETKQFKEGVVSAQVRALLNNGKAYASDKFPVGVKEVNNDEVLV